MATGEFTAKIRPSVGSIAKGQWDALAGADNPFTSHAFLTAMEDSGSVGPGTGWQNHFTLSMSADPPFDPFVCVDHVSPAALLMVVASHDVVASTEVALAAFERAHEPKQLQMVEGHHFVDYQGDGFDHVVGVMTDFLLAHL